MIFCARRLTFQLVHLKDPLEERVAVKPLALHRRPIKSIHPGLGPVQNSGISFILTTTDAVQIPNVLKNATDNVPDLAMPATL